MKLLTTILVLLLLGGCEFGSDRGSDRGQSNFVAYSWSKPELASAEIIPFYWLETTNMHVFEDFVAQAVEATRKMPEGHRALFSWDLHRVMAGRDNGDFLYTPEGDVAGCSSDQGFRPYRSLWWDKGVERVRQLFDTFFKTYAQAGGKLDVFVLDFEQGFSYWHLYDIAKKQYSCGLEAWLDAIQNDPRFAGWKQQLEFDDLKAMNQWYENDDHLKWLSVVWPHLAGYINTAVYEPMKQYFPDAELSNYGYYYQSTDIDLPDIHGFDRHRYTKGIHTGTHQSRELYGWVELPEQARLGGAEYPSTPFNAFRFAVNKLQAMLASSPIPVSPWVAYKSFEGSYLRGSDYYQELIFHTLLSGVDYLLYWNPSQQPDFSPADDVLLGQLIARVNQLVESRQIYFGANQQANWLDDVLITKIRFGDDSELWRLTVNLEAGESFSSLIEQENPARLRLGQAVLDFEGMRVLEEDALSNKGLWLISD